MRKESGNIIGHAGGNYDRFNKILKRDTQFFDVLVGYFRASGFHLLQDSLDLYLHFRQNFM